MSNLGLMIMKKPAESLYNLLNLMNFWTDLWETMIYRNEKNTLTFYVILTTFFFSNRKRSSNAFLKILNAANTHHLLNERREYTENPIM